MSDGGGIALLDGVRMALEQACLPVTDPAVTTGWSVFETLRSRPDGSLRKVPEHLERLRKSCVETGIELPDPELLVAEITTAAASVVGEARIRVTLSGSGRRIVTAQPLDPERMHQPVRAVRGHFRHEPYLGGSVKHGSRAPWVAAVKRSGADEVLMVDGAGHFTEGTTAAILAVVDGILWTAPHDGRILESTTCVEILERAEALGIPIRREGPPASGPWDGLYIASTTRDLAPVVELDGQALSGWDPVGRRLALRMNA